MRHDLALKIRDLLIQLVKLVLFRHHFLFFLSQEFLLFVGYLHLLDDPLPLLFQVLKGLQLFDPGF